MDTLMTDDETVQELPEDERIPLNEYRLLVTPEIAAEFLERNTNNRRPKPTQINKISKALLLGEWRYNGEAIKFDWNGVLLDGQNRCQSIVNTGVAAESLIVEGLPPETQKTMDGIVPRTLKDILHWRGEKDSSTLAAVLNLIHVWDKNAIRNAGPNRPTNGQAEAMLDEHPEIRDAVKAGLSINRKVPISATMAAACWYRFNASDSDDNEEFWHAVITHYLLPDEEDIAKAKEANQPPQGKAASPNSGPVLLRKYLDNDKSHRDVPQWVKHALVIKAWNLYKDGDETKKYLSFKAGGRGGEKFPEPK